MSSETLYRWVDAGPGGPWVDTDDMRRELIEDGVLVPVGVERLWACSEHEGLYLESSFSNKYCNKHCKKETTAPAMLVVSVPPEVFDASEAASDEQ